MNENKLIYLTDSPNVEQDSFQIHSNIAETLYNIITRHNVSNNSFTIGLFGEWGSGKSFIINKLSKKIKSDSTNITLIYIDVWKYSGQPLLRSILFELDKQFKSYYKENKEKYEAFKNGYKNNKGKSLQDILYYDEIFESKSQLSSEEFKEALKCLGKKYKSPLIILALFFFAFIVFQFIPNNIIQTKSYLKILQPILNGVGVFGTFIGISGIFISLLQKPLKDIGNLIFFRNTVRNFTEKANFSPEQFEGIFKDFLSKIKDEKYVIVFDNIDRCEPSIAYKTLSTIKTFMDVKNCFYIIPADDDAIKNYLTNSNSNQNENLSFERKFTEEFIDKIFQTYIRIPILKEVERDEYIKEQLKKIDFQDRISNEDIDTITQILYFAYKGESPRNIIRFINDYSTYFQLALKSLPNLLEDITLFTIMIAIKQKWYHFEKILLENPDFFARYPENKELLKKLENNNSEELIDFLDSIQSYFIPKIKNKSFNNYIHFKESEKSLEISEILKTNKPDKLKLNDETVKILIREFQKLTKIEGQFSVNSFILFAKLIVNNSNDRLSKNLIIEFWLGFIRTSQKQLKSIFGALLGSKILDSIINTLDCSYLSAHKINIEETILNYLSEPVESNSDFEEYERVFDVVINSEYKFTPSRLKRLFNNWKKDNKYLNSLLRIISKRKKSEYLPDNVLKQLVNSNIDNVSLEILKNWNHRTIPKSIGIELFKVVLQRIKQRDFVNNQQLAQQKSYIEQDYELILLLDISFVGTSQKDDFINTLCNLINRIFQYASNQQTYFELGVKLWIEVAYFASINKELIDNNLYNIFIQHIKTNPTVLNLFKEELSYPKDILSLPKTKQIIFDASSDIQQKLYDNLEIDASFDDFELVTTHPINIKHLDILFQFISDNNLEIDKNKLSEFLFEKVIYEIVNNKTDVTEKLKYLEEKLELERHTKLIIENKNGLIDYTKENPEIALNILKVFKSLLPYSEFFNIILKPILTFIESELEQGEDISKFNQIFQLIESPKNRQDLELLFSISKHCLERNQTIEENYLGIGILEKIYKDITKEDKDDIRELIQKNDHCSEWNGENLQKLQLLGIIENTETDET